MSWLDENADELAALGLVFAGIYLCLVNRTDTGYSLISLGTGYLFGKHPPRRRAVRVPNRPDGGVVIV